MMTVTQLRDMERRLVDLEQRNVEHPLSDETLRQLREWFQGVKRREHNKIIDINEWRRSHET